SILPGPEYGLWPHIYWIPPFSFIRAPLRFSLIFVLGLSVLAGYAFDRYSSWLSARRAWILTVVVSFLFVVEFLAIPLETIPQTVVIPEADRWLDARQKPFIIAEVPMRDELVDTPFANKYNARYMLHSTAHFQGTVMGYTGVLPDDYQQ